MRPRILFVDDEKNVLFAVRDYFDSIGLEVDCASAIEEGARLLEENDYAVAIVDLRLGGSDDREGLELVRIIRDRGLDTRTVVLTAYGSAVSEEVLALGIDAFLKKPRPLHELARTVCELTGATLPTEGR